MSHLIGNSAELGWTAVKTLLPFAVAVVELRRRGWLGALLDRHPSVLVAHGRLQTDALRSAGLTRSDVYRLLRQAGAGNLQSLEYVLYEAHGGITVVRTDQQRTEPIQAGLAEAGLDPQ